MVVLLCLWLIRPLAAQQPPVHYWHQGAMPPGAIGSQQLQRGGPLHGFFQPVKIKAPPGVLISLAEEGDFSEALETPATVGLLIGQVYRIRAMNIPMSEGLEVFPTVEAIDRLYTPAGRGHRFPIEIQLTLEDLRLALDGKFVTRVIYLEDPKWAVPYRESPQGQHWFEAGPGRDPLAIADQLGRPVAILRMGARLPDTTGPPTMGFLFGCPPLVKYPARTETPEPSPGPTPTETVRAFLPGPRR
jgi:hypothetical protein